jgi:hypothetical protein
MYSSIAQPGAYRTSTKGEDGGEGMSSGEKNRQGLRPESYQVEQVPHITGISKPTQWKLGQSGNPSGRPVGSRQAFSAGFHRDLAAANATVAGTVSGTLNFTQWTAQSANGLGLAEEIFTPCIPASGASTAIAINAAAPGTRRRHQCERWRLSAVIRFLAGLGFLSLLCVGQADAFWHSRDRTYNAPPRIDRLNLYFAAVGSDNDNNCQSIGTPCQTITKLNGLTLVNGQIINFNGGDTFSGSIALSGTSGVTVQAYGTGQPIVSSGNSATCITATNTPRLTIQNIICTGGGNTTNSTNGIYVNNNQGGNTKLAGPTIDNVTVSGYGLSGILIQGGNGSSGFNNVMIENSTIHDSTGNGAQLTGCIVFNAASYGSGTMTPAHTNVTIQNNLAYNCTGKSSGNKNWTGSGIMLGETSTALVTGNVVHDFGTSANYSGGGPYGIWANDSAGITISFNEVYNGNSLSNIDGGGFDLDGGVINSVVEYNYAHDNAGPCVLMYAYNDGSVTTWHDNTARYNVCQNNASTNLGELFCGNSSGARMTNCNMYSNTLYHSTTTAPLIRINGVYGTLTGTIANNILIVTSSLALFVNAAGHGNMRFNGNLYTGPGTYTWEGTNYTSFTSFQSASVKRRTASRRPRPVW